jgi:hypothetical protein
MSTPLGTRLVDIPSVPSLPLTWGQVALRAVLALWLVWRWLWHPASPSGLRRHGEPVGSTTVTPRSRPPGWLGAVGAPDTLRGVEAWKRLTQYQRGASVKRTAIAAPSIDYYVSSIAVANSNGILVGFLDLGVQLKPQHQAHLWSPPAAVLGTRTAYGGHPKGTRHSREAAEQVH